MAQIIQPPTGRKRGGPLVQDPFHRAIGLEVQANQLRGIRLQASIRLRLHMLESMEARSGLPRNHISLDDARTLAWIGRRQAALSTLLVPMPRPSRFTTQVPACTGPTEPMAVPDSDPAYTAAVPGPPPRPVPRLAPRHTTTTTRAGRPGRGNTDRRPVIQRTTGANGVDPRGPGGGLGRLCHQRELWRNCEGVLLPQFLDRAPG